MFSALSVLPSSDSNDDRDYHILGMRFPQSGILHVLLSDIALRQEWGSIPVGGLWEGKRGAEMDGHLDYAQISGVLTLALTFRGRRHKGLGV